MNLLTGKVRLAAMCAALLCLTAAFASEDAPREKWGNLYFTGHGRPNPGLENVTQRRSLSRESAIIDGKARIARYIQNMKMDKNLTLSEAMVKDPRLPGKVKMFLSGIQPVKSRWDKDDNCTVTLKMNKKAFLKQVRK